MEQEQPPCWVVVSFCLIACAERQGAEKVNAESPVKSRLSALLMARQKELESPTFRLGGGCSIQLSYWRI